MRLRWWTVGLLAAAVGGTLLLWRRIRPTSERFQFVEEEEQLKNFGAFPPDIPETEFDGVNFLY